ncbi:MAG: hypothetical protein RL059_1342, partial [Bacteroidota bacterium]
MLRFRVVSLNRFQVVSMSVFSTQTKDQSYFRLLLPHSNKKLRLGFGNTGQEYKNQINNIIEAIEKDEHFEFG